MEDEKDKKTGDPIFSSFWTKEEMDLFFELLKKCSKNDPYEIASRLGTKNEVEVSSLIGLLRNESLCQEFGSRKRDNLESDSEDLIEANDLNGSDDEMDEKTYGEIPQAIESDFPFLEKEMKKSAEKIEKEVKSALWANDNRTLTEEEHQSTELLDLNSLQQLAAEIFQKHQNNSDTPIVLLDTLVELSGCLEYWLTDFLHVVMTFCLERNSYCGRLRKEGLMITKKDVDNALDYVKNVVNKR